MRFNCANTPLIQAALPLVTGIVMERELIAGSLIALFLIVMMRKSAIPIVGFIALGFVLSAVNKPLSEIPKHTYVQLVTTVENVPEIRGRWQVVRAENVGWRDSLGQWHANGEKSQLYIDTAARIAIGQTIQFRAKCYPTLPYLQNVDVMSRCFGYRAVLCHSDTTLLMRIEILRRHISERIARADTLGAQSTAIMQSLAIGDRSSLDKAQRAEYARVGVAHLLAVSGLHVGFVVIILNLLLGWIKLFRQGYLYFGLVMIVLLWFYALLAGFSPSIVRAVVMFTLYQIGVMFSRGTSTLNVLLAAAMVILIANPNYLMDIGFQLSFVAMLGIATLYPLFKNLWHPESRVLRAVWELTAVSMAAQIAVQPLVCYYFGQIPLVGLIMNLALWLVVPTIIFGTFAYALLQWEWLGEAVVWLAQGQNRFIGWSASHDWVAIENVDFSLWMCLVSYIALSCATILIGNATEKQKHYSRANNS